MCSQYQEVIEDGHSVYQWAAGFMSGINNARLSTSGEFADLSHTTQSELIKEVGKICENNKQYSIEMAVGVYYADLQTNRLN
jgi:hypothetical protein